MSTHTWRETAAWAGILGPQGGSTAYLGKRKAELRPSGGDGCGLQVRGGLGRDSPSLRLLTLVCEAIHGSKRTCCPEKQQTLAGKERSRKEKPPSSVLKEWVARSQGGIPKAGGVRGHMGSQQTDSRGMVAGLRPLLLINKLG